MRRAGVGGDEIERRWCEVASIELEDVTGNSKEILEGGWLEEDAL